jgi:hypothetical protein
MTDKYKFKDKAWDVKHKDGRHIDTVSVHADDVRQFHKEDPSRRPSSYEDELLDNALGSILWNHKLKPEDVEVTARVKKPKAVTRKATGGRACW